MRDLENIWFTDHGDGHITVDRFPQLIRIAPELLREAGARYLTREGRTVRIHVSNGEATYRLTGRGTGWRRSGAIYFVAERMRFSGPGAGTKAV